MSTVFRLIRFGFQVTLVCPASPAEQREVAVLFSGLCIEYIFVAQESIGKKIVRLAKGLVFGQPLTYFYYLSRNLRIETQQQLSRYSWDLVFLERLPIIDVDRRRTIFDQTDSFSTQVRLFRNFTSLKGMAYWVDSLLVPRFERRISRIYNYILVTTPLEVRRVLDTVGEVGAVKVISCVHDIQSEAEGPRLATSREGATRLGFHGKLSYEANQRALRRLGALAPLLSSRGVDLVICGAAPESIRTVAPTLSYIGYVDNLFEYCRGLYAGIFPIRECVGIQNKVLECLAAGTPVIVSDEIEQSLPEAGDLRGKMIFSVDIGDANWMTVVGELVSGGIRPTTEERMAGVAYVQGIQTKGREMFKAIISEIIGGSGESER